jgi:hypothetical protein
MLSRCTPISQSAGLSSPSHARKETFCQITMPPRTGKSVKKTEALARTPKRTAERRERPSQKLLISKPTRKSNRLAGEDPDKLEVQESVPAPSPTRPARSTLKLSAAQSAPRTTTRTAGKLRAKPPQQTSKYQKRRTRRDPVRLHIIHWDAKNANRKLLHRDPIEAQLRHGSTRRLRETYQSPLQATIRHQIRVRKSRDFITVWDTSFEKTNLSQWLQKPLQVHGEAEEE